MIRLHTYLVDFAITHFYRTFHVASLTHEPCGNMFLFRCPMKSEISCTSGSGLGWVAISMGPLPVLHGVQHYVPDALVARHSSIPSVRYYHRNSPDTQNSYREYCLARTDMYSKIASAEPRPLPPNWEANRFERKTTPLRLKRCQPQYPLPHLSTNI